MKVPTTYVVGAGGIGCTVGYGLLASQRTVTFVDVDADKLDWGNKFGVGVLQGENWPRLRAQFIHFNNWKPQNDDTVFLCVKCFDNCAVLAKVGEDVELVPVQNGYDPQLESRRHVYEGIASFVARCEPGQTEAQITRAGVFHFGSRTGFAANYGKILWPVQGLPTKHVEDIRPIKAAKLMYNAAISPLAAAAGLDNGDLLADSLARRLFFQLLQENYRILNAARVPLGKVGPFHPRMVARILRTPGLARFMAMFFVRSLRGTYCSMAGDIEQGRTELDNYTGHLLRLALGTIDAPCNRAVMEVVGAMTHANYGVLRILAQRFAGS